MSGSIHFELTLGDEPALMIDAKITAPADVNAFVVAFDGCREALWPNPVDDAGAAKDAGGEDGGAPAEGEDETAQVASERRRGETLNVIPGTRLHDTLELLRRGVVDPVAIADEIDVRTNVAASFKARLIRGGHWSPDAGAADVDRDTQEEA